MRACGGTLVWVLTQMRAAVARAGPAMHEVGLTESQVLSDMAARGGAIRAWLATYVRTSPQQGTELRMGPGCKGTLCGVGLDCVM